MKYTFSLSSEDYATLMLHLGQYVGVLMHNNLGHIATDIVQLINRMTPAETGWQMKTEAEIALIMAAASAKKPTTQ